MNARKFFQIASFATVLLAPASWAAGPVVAEGLGLAITADDLNADAQRLPVESRATALSRPEAVQQASSNLFIRRALAAEAERDGLDKDPLVAATLRVVRDRVLSDARLAQIDAANKPSEDAVEKAARAAYQADLPKYVSGDEIRARHVLIAGNDAAAKAAAEKVHAELKAGADFEKIAREQSADKGSGERGGDLGFFDPAKMVPEFRAAVQRLKTPGELSEPVLTQFGWHVIKLEGRRPGGQRTYEEVRDELRRTVTNQLQSDARLKEARRLGDAAKFNRENIEAFSAPYRK